MRLEPPDRQGRSPFLPTPPQRAKRGKRGQEGKDSGKKRHGRQPSATPFSFPECFPSLCLLCVMYVEPQVTRMNPMYPGPQDLQGVS